MSDKKPVFYVREFLNREREHSSAHIIFEIPSLDSRKKDTYPEEATLVIADCSRSISLDLGWYDEKEFQNSLDKLDLLVDNLIRFRKHYKRQGSEP